MPAHQKHTLSDVEEESSPSAKRRRIPTAAVQAQRQPSPSPPAESAHTRLQDEVKALKLEVQNLQVLSPQQEIQMTRMRTEAEAQRRQSDKRISALEATVSALARMRKSAGENQGNEIAMRDREPSSTAPVTGPLLEGLAPPPRRGIMNERLTCYRNATFFLLYASRSIMNRQQALVQWVANDQVSGLAPVGPFNRAANIAALNEQASDEAVIGSARSTKAIRRCSNSGHHQAHPWHLV